MPSELSIDSLRLFFFFFLISIGNYCTVSLLAEEPLIITSATATGVLGFIATILLFCIPELDAFYAHDALQPRSSTHSLLEKVQPSSTSP